MAKEYTVQRIVELTVDIAPGGKPVRVYRHTIKTQGGTTLTVDIPEADFTPARAAPLLEQRAIEADKILSL